MRKLPLLSLGWLIVVLTVACNTGFSDRGELRLAHTISQAEARLEASQMKAEASFSIGEWCQQPSWLFGLPNIVALMAIIGLVAIGGTIVVILVNHWRSPSASNPPSEKRSASPINGKAGSKVSDKAPTGKTGAEPWVEAGAGNQFTLHYEGRTYAGRHDGNWKELTITSAGKNYTYTDNIGKGSYLCVQADAPFGKLLKVPGVAV